MAIDIDDLMKKYGSGESSTGKSGGAGTTAGGGTSRDSGGSDLDSLMSKYGKSDGGNVISSGAGTDVDKYSGKAPGYTQSVGSPTDKRDIPMGERRAEEMGPTGTNGAVKTAPVPAPSATPAEKRAEAMAPVAKPQTTAADTPTMAERKAETMAPTVQKDTATAAETRAEAMAPEYNKPTNSASIDEIEQKQAELQQNINAAQAAYSAMLDSGPLISESMKLSAKADLDAAQKAYDDYMAELKADYIPKSNLDLYDYINDRGNKREEIDAKTEITPLPGQEKGVSMFKQGGAQDWRKYALLTDDEKKEYNRIYAAKGANEAAEYIDGLSDELNKRYGAEIATGNNYAQELMFGAVNGAKNSFNLGGDPTAADYAFADMVQQKNENGKNFSKSGQGFSALGLQAAQSIGNQIPSLMVSGLMGLAGAGEKAAQLAGNLVMGASVYSNAYQEAASKGYGDWRGKLYAAGNAAMETTLGTLLGGAGKFSGLSEEKLMKIVATSNSALWRFIASTGINVASEVTEEELQNYLEPALWTLLTGEEYDEPTLEDFFSTFWTTALSTGALSAPQNIQMAVDPVTAIGGKDAYANAMIDKAARELKRSVRKNRRNDQTYRTTGGVATDADVARTAAEVQSRVSEMQAQAAAQNAQATQSAANPANNTANEITAPRGAETAAEGLTQPSGTMRTTAPSQFNIDNAASSIYNLNREAGVPNAGAEGLDENAGRDIRLGSNTDGLYQSGTGFGSDGRGNIQHSGVVLLSQQSRDTLNQRGVSIVDFGESTTDNAAFSVALDNARNADQRNGWAVTPKSAEELNESGTRTFLDGNGSSGFAISKDGDIQAVFSNKNAGAPRGTLNSLLPTAIANGGVKLDCYGGVLAGLYMRYGFIPVARTTFNPEYANPGWTPDKGSPDIYFLVHNGDSADTVIQNTGNYEIWTQDRLAALPEMDYEDAERYRDRIIEQRQNELGAANAGFSSDFSQWQEETPGTQFHPINAEAEAQSVQNGRSPVEIPTVNPQGRLTSKTASTLANAGITPDSFRATLTQEIADGKFSRLPITDNAANAAAEANIRSKGWDQALADWMADSRNGTVSKQHTADGIALYNNAVTKGDAVTALNIASELISSAQTTAQALQALSIINKLSPSGQLYNIAQSAQNLQDRINARLKKGKNPVEITLDPDLANQFLNAETEQERTKAREALIKDAAMQIPSTFKDKFDAWRMMAMLGNPRTVIRNNFGNLTQAVMTSSKYFKSAIAESIFNRWVQNHGGRTKALLNFMSRGDRALMSVGWSDFENVRDAIGSGRWRDENMVSDILSERQIFKGVNIFGKNVNPLEGARKLINWAQSDTPFQIAEYSMELAGYLKANNITSEMWVNGELTDEQMFKARNYAAMEAAKSTYHDINALSEFLTEYVAKPYRSDNKAAVLFGGLIESVMPFKKTPANILARTAEYSPMGLAKSILIDPWRIGKTQRNGETFTAAQWIDNVSAGMTGTQIAALGAWLTMTGRLHIGKSGSDKEDDWDELKGGQAYSLIVGDKSITLDWMGPAAMELFFGAELYENIASGAGKEHTVESVLDAMGRLTDPIMEMSMMQGLNDALENASTYGGLGSAARIAVGVFTQTSPTLFGQIERTFFEDKRQTTYVDRNNGIPNSAEYQLGSSLNKVPGLEYGQIDYIDAWGRKQSTGDETWRRALRNFGLPWNVSEDRSTPIDGELERLYEAGFNVLPTRAATSTQITTGTNGFTGDAVTRYLTGEEYEKFQTTKGQTAYNILSEYLTTPEYKALNDAERADFIKDVYTYANYEARRAVGDKGDYAKWYETYKDNNRGNAVPPDMYFSVRNAAAGSNGSVSQGRVKAAILARYPDNERMQEKLWDVFYPDKDFDAVKTAE